MTDAAKPLVLISHEMLAPMQSALEREGYGVAKRWELDPAQAPAVRAIVHAGEIELSPDFLSSLPALGLIATVSAGYDGVDVPWCRARGVEVTHSKGQNAEDVADHAMGLLLGAWRGVVADDRGLRAGVWRAERMAPRRGLGGRKLGIVGLGHIGRAVAVRAEAFQLQVSWWGPNPKPEAAWPRAESLLALAQASDILVLATRAEAGNRAMIDRAVIEAAGPQGLIVNVARGSVVDEDELISALKDGRLGAAALDVFETEPTPTERWADVPNTVLTPHTAGGTSDSVPKMVGQALENLRRYFAGEELLSPV